MRSVIRCDHINGTVLQSLYDRHAVAFGPKRRIHLGIGAVCDDRIVRKSKVMGGCFGVDIYSVLTGLSYGLYAFRCGDMLDIHAHSGAGSQLKVSSYERIFSFRGRTADPVMIGCFSAVYSVIFDK